MPDNVSTKNILIVDDQPTILLSLLYALRAEGANVLIASRVETAEKALKKDRFDVVITDICLSGMLEFCGLELVSYIKRNWPQTKVITMTAYGSEELKREAIERGASQYYEKPINIRELTRQVWDRGAPQFIRTEEREEAKR